MINIDPSAVADNLGLWHGTHWLLTLFPAWALIVMPLLISYGFHTVVRYGIEWQSLKMHKQYRGFMPGDLFASIGLGLLCVGIVFYAGPVVSPFWRSPFWNMVTLLVMLCVFGGLAAVEYRLAIKYRRYRDNERPSGIYSLYQLHTPTALVHRFVTIVFPYLFMKVGVVALSTGSVPMGIKVIAVMALVAWLVCVGLDNFTDRPDLADIYPMSRAWFNIGKKKPLSYDYPVQPVRAGDHTIAGGMRTGYGDWPVSPAGGQTTTARTSPHGVTDPDYTRAAGAQGWPVPPAPRAPQAPSPAPRRTPPPPQQEAPAARPAPGGTGSKYTFKEW